MTSPRRARNSPSTISTTGILSLGFDSRSRLHLDSSPLRLETTNRIDLGIMGDHCRKTRLPFTKLETVNCSMKLFERPIPT